MNQIYNFSAGPSMLPTEVMTIVQQDFKNWNNLGVSVIEISHRSQEFMEMTIEAEKNLRNILLIPASYKILFCHGGARGQFSAIPMNLSQGFKNPEYINTGYWSISAAEEAKKYCSPYIINARKLENIELSILPMSDWKCKDDTSYLHYCPNETLEGIAINEEPIFHNKIVVGDFSSTILSRVIDVTKYGLIYAGAQKNIGASGITLVIIKKSLLKDFKKNVPSILNYRTISEYNSMFNTPSTFSWYVTSLVFQWIKKCGGISIIEQNNNKKAKLIYKTIDSTDFYVNNIAIKNRSKMNIPFYIIDTRLHNIFLKESLKVGLIGLKGHSLLGGLRASIYNAMPIKGVQKLVNFMKIFEKKYG